MPLLFERVTIAGVGLIGGSLALAARAAGLIGEVVGYGRTAANLDTALRRGIIDRASHDPVDAARDADLLLLAVPVQTMAGVARTCAPALRADAVVSDVGSVKESVIRSVEPVLPSGLAFVGAHPIAGTEQSGAAAARADLFRGSRCVLTPSARSTPAALEKIRALWEGAGMQVMTMTAAQHDDMLAWVSHLPHAIAFSAVTALLQADAGAPQLAGPSFRGLTRVAASSAEMWADIFVANATPLDAAMTRFAGTLDELRRAIAARDPAALRAWLERARAAHEQWRKDDTAG